MTLEKPGDTQRKAGKAMKREAKQDRKKTGEVLSYFDGAEMFDQMCREHEDFSERFQSLVKEYRDAKS